MNWVMMAGWGNMSEHQLRGSNQWKTYVLGRVMLEVDLVLGLECSLLTAVEALGEQELRGRALAEVNGTSNKVTTVVDRASRNERRGREGENEDVDRDHSSSRRECFGGEGDVRVRKNGYRPNLP
jgi:hypothetical protein